MLIPTPMSILEIVKEIPVGHCMAASELREELAFRNGADYTCPLTTGIFLRILAEATEEASQTGSDTLAPWWRVVPDDGKLSLKLPGQGKLQKQRLEAEGWEFVPKGLTWKLIR